MAKNTNGLYIGIGTAALASMLAALYASKVYRSKKKYKEALRMPIPNESLPNYTSNSSPQQLENARIDNIVRNTFQMALANTASGD